MKSIKDHIFLRDWLELHPYSQQVSSDSYFIKLSNKLLDIINHTAENEFSTKTRRIIALSVAAYFEDLISGFGLWQAFTRKHMEMYGKYLPFYNLTGDYDPEVINPEDICFIIWSLFQKEILKEKALIINPENPLIMILGLALYSILEKEYETAPGNEYLTDFFTEDIDYEDIYSFRNAVAWIFYNSYLMKPYTEDILTENLKDLDKYKKDGLDTNIIAYSIRHEIIFTKPCGPLALKPLEWMIAIVGKNSDLGQTLSTVKFRAKNPRSYLVTGEDEKVFTLLPFDDEEPILLTKDSLQGEMFVKSGEDAFLCNLLFYKGIWHVNGFITKITKGIYDENKEETKKKKENAAFTNELFLKANNNKPIAYFRDEDEVSRFIVRALSLKEEINTEIFKDQFDLVVFEDCENGFLTMSDIAIYIKDKNNPCYEKEEAENSGICLLTEYDLPQDMIEYLIKNDYLPDLKINSLSGEKRGKELVQENLDFMFRFFQPNSFV